jgi:predicted dienelactone hydrolase
LRRRIRMLLSVSIPRVGDWTVMLLAGSSYNVVLYASVCFIYDLWILYVLLIESLLVTGKPNSVGDGSYVVEIFFF